MYLLLDKLRPDGNNKVCLHSAAERERNARAPTQITGPALPSVRLSQACTGPSQPVKKGSRGKISISN